MFNNLIILNENPKQPLKTLDAQMSFEEFDEFFQELIDNGLMIEWAYNANNPELQVNRDESEFITLVSVYDSKYGIDEVRFHTVYPSSGVMLAIPNFTTREVSIRLVYGVDEFWEVEVCEDCFQSIFDVEDTHDKAECVVKMYENYPIIQHDQSRDNEFSKQSCDCCGSKLHGRRHFLVCMKGE